jgi:hypothetical protein
MIDFIISNNHFFMFIILGVLFSIIGIYKNHKIDSIRKNGTSTKGEIEEYITELSYSSDFTRTFYHPVIKFTDSKGKIRKIKHDVGTTYLPNKKLPYQIKIYYIENNGTFEIVTESIIDDSIPMLFLIIGISSVIINIFFFFYTN